MSLRLRRWLLAPVTSWHAHSLAKLTGLSHEQAWEKARVILHPDDMPFVRQARQDRADRERDGEQDPRGR
ncbi:hypothetical protein [Streptomyces goshikiensis]|uniref:hypothetical protein n=1 Tax=Streptomyces goshikiensis TaxID=1942 RepID=UPI003810F6B1